MTVNIYVVRLDRAVLNHKKFREKNPGHDARKPCVYVGMTYLCPEERFLQHLMGVRSARFVRRYGVDLVPRLYERFNPMTRETAERFEIIRAERLRARGYAVWQN